MSIDGQIQAIVWAQWRSMRNRYPRTGAAGWLIGVVFTTLWYLAWLWGAIFVAVITASPAAVPWLERYLGSGLLAALGYWQLMPLMMASTGAALDLKRLLVYPVPHRRLFGIELLLRVTTGVEMVLLLCGLGAGLALNPAIPKTGLLAVPFFILFNLCLAAGLRGVLKRLFERKGLREIAVIALVMIAALPQLLVALGLPPAAREILTKVAAAPWPWTVAAGVALAHGVPANLAALAAWTAAAWLFGRRQFERGLAFDAHEGSSAREGSARTRHWLEVIYRLPSALFPDPLGGLVEKELRSLSRAPRFRLVFLMGFTFGLLIWLPAAHRHGTGNFMAQNYLVFVSGYAVMLLGEVCFWNVFGFDRGAAQFYFLAPVDFGTVLRAKNLTAGFFVLLEITMIQVVCRVLGLAPPWEKVAESYAVACLLTLLFLALGNLGSVYYPRAVNPAQSWRTSSPGRIQAYLLLLLPVLVGPVALAFLARWALDSELAFFGVLAVAGAIGGAVYWVATDSAVAAADLRREQFIEALSRGDGPIAG